MMTAGGVVIGEIAHIQGPLPASPRLNPVMMNEQRREYQNLLMLCGTHHTIIDTAVDEWTVSKLQDLKRSHEARATLISQAAQDLGVYAPVLRHIVQVGPADRSISDGLGRAKLNR
jgi:hypothetical protein